VVILVVLLLAYLHCFDYVVPFWRCCLFYATRCFRSSFHIVFIPQDSALNWIVLLKLRRHSNLMLFCFFYIQIASKYNSKQVRLPQVAKEVFFRCSLWLVLSETVEFSKPSTHWETLLCWIGTQLFNGLSTSLLNSYRWTR
jgi:hypothetical protein